MNKIDLYRKINASRPDVVERLISLWGNSEFRGYVDELLDIPAADAKHLPDELADVVLRLAGEHRKEFPQFGEALDAQRESSLNQNESFKTIAARFPRIAKRLRLAWGSKEFRHYIDGLLNDTRGGKRQGFPPEVLFALNKIVEEHDRQNPDCAVIVRDVWTVGGVGG